MGWLSVEKDLSQGSSPFHFFCPHTHTMQYHIQPTLSTAMDWEALAGAGQFFKGCAFTPEALAQAAQKIAGQAGNDISKFLAQLTI